MDPKAQQSELKRLILKGKEQGFLTYREINDHLPEDMHDTDQIETVVNMINDMGSEVYDNPPDPDSLILKHANPDDEEVVEEAEAVLTTAVESEFGRTTDPVRMYMREMGTVDLLTREDEINLAKRIEDGIKQSVDAISTCPVVISELVTLIRTIEREEMRLTDLISGFIDPNAVEDDVIPTPVVPTVDNNPTKQASAADGDADTEETDGADDDDDTPAVVDTGPDPVEARERFARIVKGFDSMVRSIEKNGPGKPAIKKHRTKLADRKSVV